MKKPRKRYVLAQGRLVYPNIKSDGSCTGYSLYPNGMPEYQIILERLPNPRGGK